MSKLEQDTWPIFCKFFPQERAESIFMMVVYVRRSSKKFADTSFVVCIMIMYFTDTDYFKKYEYIGLHSIEVIYF